MRTSQRSFAITAVAAVVGGLGVAGAALVAQPASGAPEPAACVRPQVRPAQAQHRLEQCQDPRTPTVDPIGTASPVV